MGPGEYVAELPGDAARPGHFGLAVGDYTHSTAPNRRYPDVVTQRLLKAALAGQAAPYGSDELQALAQHCTQEEDAAKKVERQVGKSAAALLLESKIGERSRPLSPAPRQGNVGPPVGPARGRAAHAGLRGRDVGSGCACG